MWESERKAFIDGLLAGVALAGLVYCLWHLAQELCK